MTGKGRRKPPLRRSIPSLPRRPAARQIMRDPREGAGHDGLRTCRGIDAACVRAHPRPDDVSLSFVRHASGGMPVKGQAPRVPRVVVQAGRVLGCACGPHHPAFPTP